MQDKMLKCSMIIEPRGNRDMSKVILSISEDGKEKIIENDMDFSEALALMFDLKIKDSMK